MDDSYWIDMGQGIYCKIAGIPEGIHLNPPLLDWKGLKDNNGNEIPYSKEKAFELLDTEKYFAMFIYEHTGHRRLADNTDKFGS